MKKIFIIIVIFLVFFCGCTVKKTRDVTDSEKFAKEYDISNKNSFIYSNVDEIIDILENKSGIILFADSDSDYSKEAVKVLKKVLDNIKYSNKIYYYDPTDIQNKRTKSYRKLLDLLDGYLEYDDNDNTVLYLPDIYIVKNGKIIDHNNDPALMKGNIEDNFTEEYKKKLYKKYSILINKFNK